MSETIDTYHKNRLQEYCQKKNISLPIYRTKRTSGPDHAPKFQTTVKVNGKRYTGHDRCRTKNQAEQSGAESALKELVPKELKLNLKKILPSIVKQESSSPASPVQCRSIEHLSMEYADIERIIANITGRLGGEIQTIWTPDKHGRYKFEIGGSDRYCENVKKRHKSSQIYFLVNPIKKIYYQKCSHPTCAGFRSSKKRIID